MGSLLLFIAVYARLADTQVSGDSPLSVSHCPMGLSGVTDDYRVSVLQDEEKSVDGWWHWGAALRMCLTSLNCVLTVISMANVMLCMFFCNLKNFYTHNNDQKPWRQTALGLSINKVS